MGWSKLLLSMYTGIGPEATATDADMLAVKAQRARMVRGTDSSMPEKSGTERQGLRRAHQAEGLGYPAVVRCFFRPAEHVSGTRIVARAEGGTQWLAHRMSFAAAPPVAARGRRAP